MNRIRLTYCIVLFLTAQLQATSDSLNLDDTIKLALKNSPSLIQARSTFEKAKLQRGNARAAFLPSLDLNTTHAFDKTSPGTGSEWDSSFQLQLKETLYNNHINLIDWESSGLELRAAEADFNNQAAQLKAEVSEKFYDLSLAYALKKTRQEQNEIIKNQFRAINDQYKQGLRTRRDFLRINSELRRSEIALKNSARDIELARLALQKVIGKVDQPLQFDIEPVDKNLKPTLPPAPKLESHYQYRSARMNKEVLKNNIWKTKREFWPQLFLTAGINYESSNYLTGARFTDQDSLNYRVGLNLQFNLLDWGIRRRNVAIAEQERVIGDARIDFNLQSLKTAHDTLRIALAQSIENYSLSKELLQYEEKSYHLLEQEYRSGRITYVELIVGVRDLLAARTSFYQTYYGLKSNYANYSYYQITGSPDET